MRGYQLYFINRNSGHIDTVETIQAASDVDAVEQAERSLGDKPLELWGSGRKVRRFEVPSASPPVPDRGGVPWVQRAT
jgi:hypothetical protein